jgi:hypothetical protein
MRTQSREPVGTKENLWVLKKCRRRLQDGKRRATLGDDVAPFFVCPAVRSDAANPPTLVDPEPGERNRSRPVRSPAVSSAPNPLGPRWHGRTWRRVSSSCGTGNRIARPTFAAPCGVMRHVPRSTNQRSREIRDAADRPALCRGGVLFGFWPSWRVSCDRRLVGVPFFPPISAPWQ